MICALLIVSLISITQTAWAQSTPDDAIHQTLNTYNAQPQRAYTYQTVGRLPAEPDTAGIVYLELVSVDTGEPVEGLTEIMVLQRSDGQWQAWLPGQPGYATTYAALPADIRQNIDTRPFQPQADPAHAPSSTYGLPYPHAGFGTITRSFARHGTGNIDFDLTGRDVSAAKDGTIIYANDTNQTTGAWWYWNAVVIQHGEREYSLYGHLAPGSLPERIRNRCDADFWCNVPVKRGEVIGAEGNTGRSTDPHLHVAFGQRVGFVSYPDLADDDRDGDRFEPVSTTFVYARQNVTFDGYTPGNIAQWSGGRLEQAAHPTTEPPADNWLTNSDFSAGTDAWQPLGALSWDVTDNTLQATHLRGTSYAYAALAQDTGHSAYADTPLTLSLQLGNTSGINKTVTVELLNAAGRQYGALTCEFLVPANTPLTTYQLQGIPSGTWAEVRVQIRLNPADSAPALLVDDAVLHTTDVRLVNLPETMCATS